MIRGLINRRYWFGFTDRVQEANFVWTQLKNLNYFNLQKSCENSAKKIENDAEYVKKGFWTVNDMRKYKIYWENHLCFEEKGDERLLQRHKYFRNLSKIRSEDLKLRKMQNHLQNNYVIGNKKALLKTMSHYYTQIGRNPFEVLPLTFHVCEGVEDPLFLNFLRYYHKKNR